MPFVGCGLVIHFVDGIEGSMFCTNRGCKLAIGLELGSLNDLGLSLSSIDRVENSVFTLWNCSSRCNLSRILKCCLSLCPPYFGVVIMPW
ncbi:hypothetical protein VIGAN_08164900 [Vigna angularis var. angularis]|uniref:Uncharacterized protein n=1 Tax=Vigna angularis var. angularis TaxID=157739 RepID=A0A0S3SQB5_PHAAN|nr:hypothetical protein VIGAN_08164900 [Vigna angularis var. angularis]